MPDTITYDSAAGRLIITEQLLKPLDWPQALKVSTRVAGSLTLESWWVENVPAGAVVHPGELVMPIAYYGEGEEEADDIYLVITAEQAQALGLQAGTYRAWTDRDEETIYALSTPAPTGLIGVTVYLLPEEAQALEQLAIKHRVRLVDILTAFAADLAGAHASSIDNRYGGRNGGSDEREFADSWFRRNVDPTGPEFMRTFADEEDQAGG